MYILCLCSDTYLNINISHRIGNVLLDKDEGTMCRLFECCAFSSNLEDIAKSTVRRIYLDHVELDTTLLISRPHLYGTMGGLIRRIRLYVLPAVKSSII